MCTTSPPPFYGEKHINRKKVNIYFYSIGSLLKLLPRKFYEQIISWLLLPAFMGSVLALLKRIAKNPHTSLLGI